MATASTLTPTATTSPVDMPPIRRRSPSPATSTLRSAAMNNAAAARCPPNDPNLVTPVSSTYPSSLHSPRPGGCMTPIYKGVTDAERTPVTPPSAYLDFLRVLSPNPSTGSPLSTATSTQFSFGANSPRWPSSAVLSGKSLSPFPRSAPRSFGDSRSAAVSSPRPSSAASSAAMSAAAGTSHGLRETVSAPPATDKGLSTRANSGRTMTRPSDLNVSSSRMPPTNVQSVPSPTGPRPQSARPGPPPKRPSLVIPPSPSSDITSMSPSQHSAPARSAYPSSARPGDKSAHPSSAVSKGRSPLSTCVSATDNNTSSPVTIRHIVTRTVTYRRPQGSSAAPAAGGNNATSSPPSAKPRRSRPRMQSPLSAVEAVSDDEDGKKQLPRLIGDVPKGKRRKVD